jgi:hypothetical protein
MSISLGKFNYNEKTLISYYKDLGSKIYKEKFSFKLNLNTNNEKEGYYDSNLLKEYFENQFGKEELLINNDKIQINTFIVSSLKNKNDNFTPFLFRTYKINEDDDKNENKNENKDENKEEKKEENNNIEIDSDKDIFKDGVFPNLPKISIDSNLQKKFLPGTISGKKVKIIDALMVKFYK